MRRSELANLLSRRRKLLEHRLRLGYEPEELNLELQKLEYKIRDVEELGSRVYLDYLVLSLN